MIGRLTIAHILFVMIMAAQVSHRDAAVQIKNSGLTEMESYSLLFDLTTTIGHRFSGSPGYDKAVTWCQKKLEQVGADSIWLEPVMIPQWVRGAKEKAMMKSRGKTTDLSICALSPSVSTSKKGLSAKVIEVQSLEEAAALGEKAIGKIIFYNRPFDKTTVNTFEAYGNAVDQRGRGAVVAAQTGAVGVLVRSMTNAMDEYPHTGTMRYYDSIPKIPAAAISTIGAEQLSAALKTDPDLVVQMTMDCRLLGDVQSYNVIGQITGSEHPEQIVLIGAHLDSWDKGTGAHDDGAGVVHCIDALRMINTIGQKPKRTIRCVLFANEENGIRGARTYAAWARQSSDVHIAAIESDEGGFTPRGFGVSADSSQFDQILSYKTFLDIVGADRITKGGGGVDIDQLKTKGTALIGLTPDNQRYFDLHHSDLDTIDKVHPRELQLGSIAMAILTWCISQDGI
jgi:carboxypeptidase Q